MKNVVNSVFIAMQQNIVCQIRLYIQLGYEPCLLFLKSRASYLAFSALGSETNVCLCIGRKKNNTEGKLRRSRDINDFKYNYFVWLKNMSLFNWLLAQTYSLMANPRIFHFWGSCIFPAWYTRCDDGQVAPSLLNQLLTTTSVCHITFYRFQLMYKYVYGEKKLTFYIIVSLIYYLSQRCVGDN